MPPHYEYAEAAWENKLLARLSRLVVPRLVGKAFLLLNLPTGVHFEGQDFYLPDLPLFVVEFRWAVPLLTDLWACCTGGLILVEQDLRAGVLIDNYIGYLSEDPNPREIIYEVGLWPVEPDEPARNLCKELHKLAPARRPVRQPPNTPGSATVRHNRTRLPGSCHSSPLAECPASVYRVLLFRRASYV
jgi:hypothetical protein